MFRKQDKEFFYEFNIHKPSQFGRYGMTFINRGSYQAKDVTFAYKLVKKIVSEKPVDDAAATEEEAALFTTLE